LYTSCVLGLRPFGLFNEFLLIKKNISSNKALILFEYIDGEPLGFNEIEKDLPAHSAKALLDSKWTSITQEVCFYFNFLLIWFSFLDFCYDYYDHK
jgi:hypothetical protein